ncbi:hypothetical protein CICLE_v10020602mg [Citrus x clementina]|uniref:Polysaccharide biosynthesis protein C-terminal domain-containing protein n=1 Tax=Citrus clementina TaxID=85681 RepID=V4VPM2_CITCL|nr:hypothetical protein CICLE_v10020602mg [Citrus x clementina]
MASALETLCGQAYGAEQFQKLGIYTHCSIISLIIVCFPISLLWIFTDKLLILVGQDPLISRVAKKYAIFLIPNLFSYAVLQSFIRFFQVQSLILPMLYSSVLTLCFHIPLCWALVFKIKLGSNGAALAVGLSYWFNVLLLGFYIKYSSECEKTRASFSIDVFSSIKEFIRFAVPSAVMVCFEWWSYEVLILLSGLLPNPKLEASVFSLCTRVSNELGAGNPKAAKMAVCAIIILAAAEMVTVSIVLLFCRHILGYALSSSEDIVHRLADMVPFICLSIIMDSLQAVLSGVARGSGWQKIGAFVNLGAYYLVGIPIAAVLAFVFQLKGKGLLIGLATGSFVQAALLALKIVFTDWGKQASKARERIFEGDSQQRQSQEIDS